VQNRPPSQACRRWNACTTGEGQRGRRVVPARVLANSLPVPAPPHPTPGQVYRAIALTAAALFAVWLCLYALKCLMYPRKVTSHALWHGGVGRAWQA
jgi:hypothetical protein